MKGRPIIYILHTQNVCGPSGRMDECSVCWEMGNLLAKKINKFHVQHSEVLRNRNMVVIIIYFIVIFD